MTSNFSVSLSPTERQALERISAKRGRAPLGAVLRQLIMEESERITPIGYSGTIEAMRDVIKRAKPLVPQEDVDLADFGPG